MQELLLVEVLERMAIIKIEFTDGRTLESESQRVCSCNSFLRKDCHSLREITDYKICEKLC